MLAKRMHLKTSIQSLVLQNVLHVPKLQHNLFSVRQLCQDNNCTVHFDDSSALIKDKAMGTTLLKDASYRRVYTIQPLSHHAFAAFTAPCDTWHSRLGYCRSRILDYLKSKQFIHPESKFGNKCVACKFEHCYSTLLYLTHSDLGQSPILSNLGYRYYV